MSAPAEQTNVDVGLPNNDRHAVRVLCATAATQNGVWRVIWAGTGYRRDVCQMAQEGKWRGRSTSQCAKPIRAVPRWRAASYRSPSPQWLRRHETGDHTV